jgi:hypothetical protein
MKKCFLASLPLCAFALTALSDSPSYKPASAQGTTSAEVIFPADPVLQIRVVGAIGSSDKASSVFSFRGGGTPAAITVASTNLSATNIYVGGYVGFSTNDLIVIQTPATNRTLTVWGLANGTNVITTAAVGVTQYVGSEIFDLGAATTLKCGAITNTSYQGEAIYVAPRGRPLRVLLDGTSYSSLDSVTVHYDP